MLVCLVIVGVVVIVVFMNDDDYNRGSDSYFPY